MRIFVAGGTGVLGRPVVRALVEAGHRVRSTARGAEKADLIRRLGAEPVDVDLYDADAIRRSIDGADAVIRLTTKIPSLLKMRSAVAWRETNRLRTTGARLLVDAAIAERIPSYIHESVVFVYADGGERWLTEDAATDDGGTEILRAALEGEREATRFSAAGGRGTVLRFGAFYGPDAPSTREMIGLAKRGALAQLGSGTNYISSVYVPDAASGVVAALDAPPGIYNVADDTPVTFAEYLRLLADAAGARRPRRLPAMLGPLMFGVTWRYLRRSQRVSAARFKAATGWRPTMKSVADGWPSVASQVAATTA